MTHRDHMHPVVGGLGKKVERPKEVKPKLVETGTKGVFKNAETGRLETIIPVPQASAWQFFGPFALPSTRVVVPLISGLPHTVPLYIVLDGAEVPFELAALGIDGDHD